MNVIVGIIIGFIGKTWIFCILTPFIWGVFHCIYGYIFKLHINPMTVTTGAGRPVLSYFFARYTTGSLTALVFSLITYLIKKFIF